MKITVDGISLLKWCGIHSKRYHTIRKRIWAALEIQPKSKRLKKTYDQIKEECKIRDRLYSGYSVEEANLPQEEFNKLRSSRNGDHKIGKYNLHYVCNKLGISYNTVFIMCIKRKRMTPREYLESKGYDLTEFEQ